MTPANEPARVYCHDGAGPALSLCGSGEANAGNCVEAADRVQRSNRGQPVQMEADAGHR